MTFLKWTAPAFTLLALLTAAPALAQTEAQREAIRVLAQFAAQ